MNPKPQPQINSHFFQIAINVQDTGVRSDRLTMDLQIDDPNPRWKGGQLTEIDPGVRGFEVRDPETPIVRISGEEKKLE